MSAPRKRRLDRLPISGTLGATKGWSPTDTDWRRMEKEYGMTRGEDFGDDLRGKIRSAVLEYFEWEPFERRAPFSKDFKEKLVKAKRLATELREVVNEFGDAGPLIAAYGSSATRVNRKRFIATHLPTKTTRRFSRMRSQRSRTAIASVAALRTQFSTSERSSITHYVKLPGRIFRDFQKVKRGPS